jgi:Na+-driven multidrug efflux pump
MHFDSHCGMNASPLKQILKLSLPIILGQLGQMLIVAGDVYVATKHSTHAVAAIGVAGGIINPIFLFGIGMTMGVSPSFAFLRGKGQNPDQQANSIFIYSLMLGLVITFATFVRDRAFFNTRSQAIHFYRGVVFSPRRRIRWIA